MQMIQDVEQISGCDLFKRVERDKDICCQSGLKLGIAAVTENNSIMAAINLQIW